MQQYQVCKVNSNNNTCDDKKLIIRRLFCIEIISVFVSNFYQVIHFLCTLII